MVRAATLSSTSSIEADGRERQCTGTGHININCLYCFLSEQTPNYNSSGRHFVSQSFSRFSRAFYKHFILLILPHTTACRSTTLHACPLANFITYHWMRRIVIIFIVTIVIVVIVHSVRLRLLFIERRRWILDR